MPWLLLLPELPLLGLWVAGCSLYPADTWDTHCFPTFHLS